MSVPMMHTAFFPNDKVEFGCICEYDEKYYLDDEERDPFEQERIWKQRRAERDPDDSELWESVEVLEYKDGKPVVRSMQIYKELTYEQIEEKKEEFALKQYRWVEQKNQKKYPQDDPQKVLYCIVEAITPKPGFEERAEKEFKEIEKMHEMNYKKYFPEAQVPTPPSLGKLVIKSKDGKPVFDFYPSAELKAWSIPELLDSTSNSKLPAGDRARAHMATVIEAQEHRAHVLYRENLEKCGWILGRALTDVHIRPAYWSNSHIFWMPVDIEVDESATGEEIVAYRNFLRADKTLTRNVQGVVSQLNKGEDNRLWSSTDITTVSNWSDIRVLFLRYLRHHSLDWNVVLPEEPTPLKGLVGKIRNCPALNGTNLLILTLVMVLFGLAVMLAYFIIFKGVRFS